MEVKELESLVKNLIRADSYNWKELYEVAEKLPVGEANYLARYGECMVKYFFKPSKKYALNEFQKESLKELFYFEISVLKNEIGILNNIFENKSETYFLTKILERVSFNAIYNSKVVNMEALNASVLPKVDLLDGVIYKAVTKTGVLDISHIKKELEGKPFSQCKPLLETKILQSQGVAMAAAY